MVSPCFPACLLSAVRPPFDLYTQYSNSVLQITYSIHSDSHANSVVPACESTQLGAGAQLYSQLAQLLPCVITGLATLDTCGVPPQVVPSSLRDLVYKPYVRFPVRVS